jgi:hypothetical protein
VTGQRCSHVRANGNRCGGFAVSGSAYCFAHAPEQAAKRDEARRKGGRAGKSPTVGGALLPVRSLDDVLGLVETSINDVRAGRLDPRTANAVGYLANVALKAIEGGDVQRRLDVLESVLEPERRQAILARRRGYR